ncbi:MAG: hypothetical protein HC934_00755 [Acaryochloridaceae cyanobacterium SU_2_1]|nr:hypothetical protein [Acaryochloridaceae cyanobacterium SU_2_1]
MIFDPALKKAYSYEDLAQAFAKKYGKADAEEIKKKIVTWVGPDFVTAQLTDSITALEGYQFQVVVPKS